MDGKPQPEPSATRSRADRTRRHFGFRITGAGSSNGLPPEIPLMGKNPDIDVKPILFQVLEIYGDDPDSPVALVAIPAEEIGRPHIEKTGA
jgi:hypothetical protein